MEKKASRRSNSQKQSERGSKRPTDRINTPQAKFHPADEERTERTMPAGSLEEETLSPDAPFNKTYGGERLVNKAPEGHTKKGSRAKQRY